MTTKELNTIINNGGSLTSSEASDLFQSDISREHLVDLIGHLIKSNKAKQEILDRKDSRIHELEETIRAIQSIANAKVK